MEFEYTPISLRVCEFRNGNQKRKYNLSFFSIVRIHLCVTLLHTRDNVADQFIADVTKEVKEIMKNPMKPVEGKMAIYGVAQTIPDRSLVGDITRCFLDSMYYTPAQDEK